MDEWTEVDPRSVSNSHGWSTQTESSTPTSKTMSPELQLLMTASVKQITATASSSDVIWPERQHFMGVITRATTLHLFGKPRLEDLTLHGHIASPILIHVAEDRKIHHVFRVETTSQKSCFRDEKSLREFGMQIELTMTGHNRTATSSSQKFCTWYCVCVVKCC